MGLIRGITVKLHELTQAGTDDFNAPTFAENIVDVDNVLVCPVSTADVASDLQLYGKRAEYELCIPKGDTHTWEDREVEFFGKSWRTFGFAQEWIAENVPLDWNRKIRVERYG